MRLDESTPPERLNAIGTSDLILFFKLFSKKNLEPSIAS